MELYLHSPYVKALCLIKHWPNFMLFSFTLTVNAGIVSHIRPRPLPCKSSPIVFHQQLQLTLCILLPANEPGYFVAS
jgi:hypothetical protein